jgi:sulfatase modifying factor 1
MTTMTALCWLIRLFDPAPEPVLVRIEGGRFELGDCFNEGDPDERPVHTVEIAAFYMAPTETTLAGFRAFIAATGYRTDAETGEGSYAWDSTGWSKKEGVDWRCDPWGRRRPPGDDRHPVIHVSWNDAARYCNWLSARARLRPVYAWRGDTVAIDAGADGYRLPTEAEWEYAAAGAVPRKTVAFAGAALPGEVGWYSGNSGKTTHRVGTKKPNRLGLYDLTGNVWEWCQNVYSRTGYVRAPQHPHPLAPRAIRGGSFNNNRIHCRIAGRNHRYRDARDCNIGFRVVRSEQ